MRSPAAAFTTTITSDQIPAAWLLEIQASTYLRYALYATDLTFNSNVYTATDGKISKIEEGLEGRAPTVTLTLQNVDGVLGTWLLTDRHGTDVVLRYVMTDNLSDSAAQIDWTFEIDAYKWDANAAEIVLAASHILDGIQTPRRTAQGWGCPWTYKGSECGYVGSLPSCLFTYEDCRKHFGATAPKRFGGFIGAPERDLMVF